MSATTAIDPTRAGALATQQRQTHRLRLDRALSVARRPAQQFVDCSWSGQARPRALPRRLPTERIVGALGLTMAGLFPPRAGVITSNGHGRRIDATYDYLGADGHCCTRCSASSRRGLLSAGQTVMAAGYIPCRTCGACCIACRSFWLLIPP